MTDTNARRTAPQLESTSGTIVSNITLEQSATIPTRIWSDELASSRSRHDSRASSIISTTTRLTASTFEDTRSIEIQAGGQSFRIHRYGSAITNTTAPPPYPGTPDALSIVEGENDNDANSIASTETETPGATSLRSGVEGETGRELLGVSDPVVNSVGTRQSQLDLSIVIQHAKRLLGISINSSGGPESDKASSPLYPKRAVPDSSFDGSGVENCTQTEFPTHAIPDNTVFEESSDALCDGRHSSGSILRTPGITATPHCHDEQISEVSRHYNNLMRDVDREYRRRLHERDKELAVLRELLNEKDIVYRQQLKERDARIESLQELMRYKDMTINELKTNIYEQGEAHEEALEEARNSVEDMWERRWKEFEKELLYDRESNSRRVWRGRSSPAKTMRGELEDSRLTAVLVDETSEDVA